MAVEFATTHILERRMTIQNDCDYVIVVELRRRKTKQTREKQMYIFTVHFELFVYIYGFALFLLVFFFSLFSFPFARAWNMRATRLFYPCVLFAGFC